MNFFRLSLKNIQGSSFRSGVVFLCALVVAALSLSILMISRGAEDSLRLAYERMGADIVVVPRGAESKVENALLMGEPAQVWMPEENLKKVAAIPGVAAVAPQIYLSTMEDAPCCAVSEMFVVVYDPATDFTVEPWLERELGRDLGLGEAIGGRYVFVPPGEQKIEMYGYYVDLKGNMEPTGTNLDQTMFLNIDTAREMARASKTQAMEELIIPVKSISTAPDPRGADSQPGLCGDHHRQTSVRRYPSGGVEPLQFLSRSDVGGASGHAADPDRDLGAVPGAAQPGLFHGGQRTPAPDRRAAGAGRHPGLCLSLPGVGGWLAGLDRRGHRRDPGRRGGLPVRPLYRFHVCACPS